MQLFFSAKRKEKELKAFMAKFGPAENAKTDCTWA